MSAPGAALVEALAEAERAADEAGAIARAGLGHAREIGRKQSTSDLVTESDLAVERAVVSRLRARFAEDGFVGEEGTGDAPSGSPSRVWYVDPIDGTTNFAHGLPFFCISIGLCDRDGPALGVIDAPALGWRFSAVRGGGAWLCDGTHERRALGVSATDRLDSALLATGFPYDLRTSPDDNVAQFAHLQRVAQAVRRVGAAALDLAMVAAGWFDGYWEGKLKPWDLVAGVVLVEEAGGRVTGIDGGMLRIESGALVASNGRIHAELLGALGQVRGTGSRSS
jgi:myo-inositol-1(or 4)-monophosphatase